MNRSRFSKVWHAFSLRDINLVQLGGFTFVGAVGGAAVMTVYLIIRVGAADQPSDLVLTRQSQAAQVYATVLAGFALMMTAAAAYAAVRAFITQRRNLDLLEQQQMRSITPHLAVQQWSIKGFTSLPNLSAAVPGVEVQLVNAGQATATHLEVSKPDSASGYHVHRPEKRTIKPDDVALLPVEFDQGVDDELENNPLNVECDIEWYSPIRGVWFRQTLSFICRKQFTEDRRGFSLIFSKEPRVGMPKEVHKNP